MYNRTDNKITHPYTKQGGLMIQIQTVQLAVVPGNVRANWKLIEKEIQKAKQKQVDVLVLPEMCLSGYLIGDIWEQDSFLEECELYGQRIIEASQNLTIVWGNVAVDRTLIGNDGHVRKYNAAFAGNDSFILPPDGEGNAWHLYILRLNLEALKIGRDEFGQALQERGLGISMHFIPHFEMSYIKERYGLNSSDFSESNKKYLQSLSLPFYPSMSEDDSDYVIETVIKLAKLNRR